MGRLYCVRQRDATDCGPACLATVCRQHGSKQALGRIRVMAGTDTMGTSAFGLVKAAEALGFSARGVRATVETLLTSDNLVLPAIAHVTSEEGLPHFVVIQRIRNGTVTISDPEHGIRTLSASQFARLWSGVLILLVPSAEGVRRGAGESTVRLFTGLLKGQGKLLSVIALASAAVTALGILAAFYFKVVIDQILPGDMRSVLTAVSLGVIALYLVRTGMDAVRYRLVLRVQNRIDLRLVLGYYDHVVGLPMSFYGTRRVGDIISRFGDASKIRDVLAGATVTVFVDVVMSIGGCVVLAAQDIVLFWIAAGLAALHGLLGAAVWKPVHTLNEDMMESNARVTAHFVETIEGAETVKAYNAQTQVIGTAESLYTSYLKKVFRYGRWQNAQSVISDALGMVGTAVIIWVGAVRILSGDMTVGTLVVFTTLLAYFLDPVRNLMNLQPEVQSAAVAARRLADILVLEPENLGANRGFESIQTPIRAPYAQTALPPIDHPIQISHVTFRYGSREPVLQDVSLTIEPGAVVGLVGESGSGKTTVAKLLMKFYTPESGDIRFGDVPIDNVTAQSVRERIAYIGQDTHFFSGTIEANLRLARPGATPEQMIRAARMAQAHDFIMAMPGRYKALLEEDAANLSGGQRQRLAIARALLRQADMLILDEATSNMDSISDKAVSDVIRRLRRGTTRLVIAHRLSTVVACDRIYVMSAGRIVETGTHEELLALGGVYTKLWQAQYARQARIGSGLRQTISHVPHSFERLSANLPPEVPHIDIDNVRSRVEVQSPHS